MARNQGKVGEAKSEIVAEIPKACSDELAAVEFFEKRRWRGEPECPRCQSKQVVQVRSGEKRHARFLWRCHGCKQQFTVRIGTVLEDSRIPLRHWAFAFWAACASKKGVSAKQIQRQTGLSYKSALFLMHRVRFAMADDPTTQAPLKGTVEVDETYVGGKPRKKGSNPSRMWSKAPVMALVERRGNVRAFPVEWVDSRTLQKSLVQNIHPTARLCTDEHAGYGGAALRFKGGHHTVNHSRGEYVRGDIHTNTVEGFFSLIKRGIYGVYHVVSRHHLHRYVAEFQFRYNTRKLDDGARTELAIRSAVGKRLAYKA